MPALLIALCLAFSVSPAYAAVINGQSYVPLVDWARANGLKCFWLRRGDEVVATNRTARLVFDKDARMVEVNGDRCGAVLSGGVGPRRAACRPIGSQHGHPAAVVPAPVC